jgi:hypothetical protein
MNVLDLVGLLNIERFKRINIEARRPEEIYLSSPGTGLGGDIKFLTDCIRRIPTLSFAHRATGQIYARIENGSLVAWDPDVFERAEPDEQVRQHSKWWPITRPRRVPSKAAQRRLRIAANDGRLGR